MIMFVHMITSSILRIYKKNKSAKKVEAMVNSWMWKKEGFPQSLIFRGSLA